MAENVISREEHEEFRRRMEADNKRTNERLKLLEENVRQIGALTVSVEKLATNMENMAKEQRDQGERLESLEGRDGAMWRTVSSYIITAIVGAVVAFILANIGIGV